jgi:hypothetical protein
MLRTIMNHFVAIAARVKTMVIPLLYHPPGTNLNKCPQYFTPRGTMRPQRLRAVYESYKY